MNKGKTLWNSSKSFYNQFSTSFDYKVIFRRMIYLFCVTVFIDTDLL